MAETRDDRPKWQQQGYSSEEEWLLSGYEQPFPGFGPRKANGSEHQDDDAEVPRFSEESLALNFAEIHAARLRYVAAWGRWYEWDGSRWRHDLTLQAYDLVRAACRQASIECKGTRRIKLADAKTVAAVEKLARSDRRLAATVDQWDANPWLLNTPAGAVDLQTGQTRRPLQDDYCTRCTSVGAIGEPNLWIDFLEKITDRNPDLFDFLHRLSGYALTGLTREHALFFGYGTGANGKSVFLNTLIGVMGDYGTTAPMEIFMASKNEQHPTGLASLRGARLVTAVETEEGRRWAESRVKALTGGDRIAARFMRQDFFEFTPQFKLLIAGNHKPGLRGVDEAIRRRLFLIPFNVTIPVEERDPDLYEKLKKEWPQILNWMVEGCLRWQREGLKAPDIVVQATEHYLETEDALSQWMIERCDVSPQAYDTTQNLFADWKRWAELAGEFAGSQKRFSQTIESRGFTVKRQAGTGKYGFLGIILKGLTDTAAFKY